MKICKGCTSKVVLVCFITTQLIFLYALQNYMSARCIAPSRNPKLRLIKDYSLNTSNGRNELPSSRSQVPNNSNALPDLLDHRNKDDMISSQGAATVLPLDEVAKEPEPQYTVTFQRDVPANYTSLFGTDSEGNCRASACKWPKMPGATRELVASAPELFEKIPLHFLDNFKNPCWVRGKNELNCLPYFYIIGTYKAGTWDIWQKITGHPDVISEVPKEPHWWGLRRYGDTYIPCHRKEILQARNLTGGKDDSSLEWYLNFYKSLVVPDLINSSITTKEGIRYHPKVFGDSSITTMYALGLDWMKTYPYAGEPPYTNADLLGALQPNAKFILMVRNPTKRADSYFWYTNDYQEPCPNGTNHADRWHKYAIDYIQCFNKCIEEHNLRYCAYAADCPYDLVPDIQVSIYHVYIRDWMKVFSRDQFKVIRLEDWQAEPAKVYRDLIKFLNLRDLTADEEKKILSAPPKNVNRRKHEETKPETWKALNDFFRPYNRELAKLMGDEKFNYPDYNGSTDDHFDNSS